ncbi:DUF4097 family beta strand repeat-containing protein [Chryseolinea sp. H1M3-3]|uniref:DUF4097 family beta strand repeat-containing protein n=1 Tax=Chryseolinea sp. H1M3-3 TaxID=3034144 RepID=UPI0023EDE83F|nr:DUF4097 family beta strand repeat-containing protein [Chryseolinea sp. H1M3-3]
MKKAFNFVFLVAFITLVINTQAQDREPYITKSFSNESIKELYARTSGGSITVEGGNEQARVEVFIKGNNGKTLSKDEIKERLDEDYKLTIGVEGNELKLIAEPKDKFFNWRHALSISFKVYVPQTISTDLSTSGGSIDMRNLSGTQSFSTSGGSLTLDKLSGKIKGRTSGGSIHVSNAKDMIDLATSGGSIEAENCNGKLSLSTSGGSISLHNLKGTVKANTSGGPIRGGDITGELTAHTSGGSVDLRDLECSVDASTSGGNMEIEIDKLEEYVTISNSGGNIHVTMPGNKGVNLNLRGDRINLENMNNFNGDKEDHKVEGKINGGGIPVNIQTSGRVTVALN